MADHSSSPPADVPGSDSWLSFDPPGDRSSGSFTRRRLSELLGGRVPADALERVQLAASELVSNAVIHGEGRVRVRVRVAAEHVRVEVIDQGEDEVPRLRRESHRPGGWGLQIVDALSTRWGVFEGSTHVWCDIPIADPG